MNVGLVVPGFSADATDWAIPALRHFSRGLARSDNVRVFAVRYPYREDRYCIDAMQVLALGGATQRGAATLSVWQRTLRALAREHRRQRFDVLHAFWATESGLLAALAGRLLRVPVLVSLAGGELVALPDIGYGDQLRPWERVKIAVALRLASAIAAGSRYLVDLAQARVRRRIEWLPLGVDTSLFAPSTACNGPRLLHVGALTPVKDQRMLLAAFAELRRRVPTARLEIVGDGPLIRHLRALAMDLRVADAVCFRLSVAHPQLPGIYAGATAFLVSSRHEAQCMVALEAASCGLPIIGTAVGVVPEIAAASVPVGDAVALARAIEQHVRGSRAAGDAARQMVERTFSLDLCVGRFRQCYARLAA